ncbi:signal peptidase II [Legionella dresdenensis]|uniref:Lipoprotein signal peptidase n=1 Tax=Legionella dresdenensis TaxID=450200 RepID=A0ABV8CDN6_9GAMM
MRKLFWLAFSAAVIALDQITKCLAGKYLIPYLPKPVMPMFNLTLAYNTGAAFSFLSDAGGWQRWFFALFSVVMSIALLVWLIRLPAKAVLQSFAVSLILGGAVGNLYDRAVLGHVTDFIDIYYNNHHFPVFNVADIAICIGAFLLVVDLCKNPSQ